MKPSAILTVLLLCCPALLPAQNDTTQSAERIDPTLEITGTQSVEYSSYSFVKSGHNHIQLNDADWSEVCRRFAAAQSDDTYFTVVYLGDSHIQADFGGSVLRQRLADSAGSAGRGLVVPFRMAGTNQPNDYTITGSGHTVSSRLLKQPWATEMPFTGIGIQPVGGPLNIHLTCAEPFDRIKLLYCGSRPSVNAINGGGGNIGFENLSETEILADVPLTDAHISITAASDFVLGGIVLSKADAGTFVHSIGNNGATYSSYNQIDRFGEGLAQLNPDLVVIALGTNEAFGTFNAETMRMEVDMLVRKVQRSMPHATILLVTPSECYRKRYRRRRGRRRAAGQTINTNVKNARDVIAGYASGHNIALYDTYEILGGDGSAAHMKAAHVLGGDGVHFTSGGYRLQGSLLADAILEALTSK